jgi:hypothetical protein
VPLLLLTACAGGNIPVRHFLDDRVYRTYVVFVEYYDLAIPLPPHQLIFNAIGDADLAPRALAAAQSLLAADYSTGDQPAGRCRHDWPQRQRTAPRRHTGSHRANDYDSCRAHVWKVRMQSRCWPYMGSGFRF